MTIRLKRSDQKYVDKVKKTVREQIPSAQLKDYHQGLMHYHVADTKQTWAQLFTKLNSLNDTLDFEDYIVSDTTLEQIFIAFARGEQQQAQQNENKKSK